MDKSRTSQQLEQLLNLYIEQQNDPSLSNMLEISLVSKMQDENAARVIISYINKHLGVALKRSKGLGLLDKIILHCPVSLLLDNAISWTNICVNCSSKEPVNMLRFTVLVKILEACSGAPDYNKSVMPLLPKIIDMCLSVNQSTFLSEGSLECLKICLQNYPSTCGPFKNKIESYLTKYITCLLPLGIVRKAGSVFHYLQQVGGSGPHKDNWRNQLTKLCSTMHKLYHQFFATVTEFENKDMDVVPFELPELSLGERNKPVASLTANALKNVVIFINCMLIERFPVEKSISILHILDVIKRGLLVDTYVEFDNSIEETQFAALLYSHQIELLYLLRSLIACFKQNVMPFSFTISKLLTDCLQRTQKNYFRSNSEYQKAVYKVLNYWIITAESKLSNAMHNKLVSLIVLEITPAKSNVILCLNENLTQKKGKGKKKTVQEPVKTDENLINRTQKSLEIKETTCAEALKTGKTLLEHVMLQLDQDTYKTLFQTIIQHLLNIQGGKVIHPYSNPKCQAYLYEMLACILMQPAFCMSPLLQIALNIFTRGQSRSVNSNNDQIFLACAKGLNILEKLCQPTCPTLHINPHISDDKLTNNSRKRTHEIEAEDIIELDDLGTSPENQHVEIEPPIKITQIFSQNDYSDSPKKIRVLDNQIIKSASFTSADDSYIDETDSLVAQIDDDTDDERQNFEIGSEDCDLDETNDETKKIIIKQQISLLQNNDNEYQQQNNDASENITCKSEVKDEEAPTDTDIKITNVCSLEKIEDIMDVDEADMLNSFKDVLSQAHTLRTPASLEMELFLF